jgi:hypothetical protein
MSKSWHLLIISSVVVTLEEAIRTAVLSRSAQANQEDTSMANRKHHNAMRHAMAQRLVFAASLACAWMPLSAIAKEGCDNLNYDESKVGEYTIPDPLLGKMGNGSRMLHPGRPRAAVKSCEIFAT